MLDRLAASTHRIRIFVQGRLHGIDNVLVLPPRDATLRSLRALSLQRAGAARVGPVAAQDQSIFLVREVVGELLTGRTNVNVLLSQRSGNPACRSGLPTSHPMSEVLAA